MVQTVQPSLVNEIATMFEHVVLLKINDDVDDATIDALEAALVRQPPTLFPSSSHHTPTHTHPTTHSMV